MKTFPNILTSLAMAFAAIMLFSHPVSAAGEGHLIVKRAANFGLNLGVDVWVDGERVTRLQYGQTYDASLTAGSHSIRVEVTAKRHSNPAQVQLRVAPGQTYKLTATWEGQVLVLR